MRRRRLWYVVIAFAALAIASPTFYLPNFWATFLIPTTVFLALQLVALGGWTRKEELFKFTDYIYYLLIGGVVALGSRFVLEAEQVGNLDALLETRLIQQRLGQIDAELPVLRDDLSNAKRSAENVDPRFVAQCQSDQLLARLKGIDAASSRGIVRIDPCLGYFSIADEVTRIPRRISLLEHERNESAKRLMEIEATKRPSASVSSERRLQDPKRLELEFRWIPMLLLLGIAIKLGKTTCSLWQLPRRN